MSTGNDRFVILATDSMNRAKVFGTKTGKVFTSEDSANRAAKSLDRRMPLWDFLVIPLQPMPGPDQSLATLRRPPA